MCQKIEFDMMILSVYMDWQDNVTTNHQCDAFGTNYAPTKMLMCCGQALIQEFVGFADVIIIIGKIKML